MNRNIWEHRWDQDMNSRQFMGGLIFTVHNSASSSEKHTKASAQCNRTLPAGCQPAHHGLSGWRFSSHTTHGHRRRCHWRHHRTLRRKKNTAHVKSWLKSALWSRCDEPYLLSFASRSQAQGIGVFLPSNDAPGPGPKDGGLAALVDDSPQKRILTQKATPPPSPLLSELLKKGNLISASPRLVRASLASDQNV